MGKIFISYRRADSEYVVGRIYEELCKSYGKNNVFKDIDSIPLGVDFRNEISEVIHSCSIVIAIIGERWNTIKDSSGNIRINNSDDFVRIEIEEALKRGIPVIPIITSRAELPKIENLPDSLSNLAYRNALSIRPDPDFKNDILKLKKAINKVYKRTMKYVVFALVIALVTSVIFLNSFFMNKKIADDIMQPPMVTAQPSSKPISDKFNLKAVINDSDGYTNVRQNPRGKILFRINQNTIFYTYKQSTEWWRIRTNDGKNGYMHKSRISLKR